MSDPRTITLSPQALNTCNHWRTIRGPVELNEELFASTKLMLENFSTQENQGPTIAGLQTERDEALAAETNALAVITQLQNRIAAHETTIANLNRMIADAPALAQQPQEKIPRPKGFDGTRSQLQAFIMQLRLHTATFRDEQAKLRLAVNCLTGNALDQARMYVQNDRVNLNNLAEFINIMETAFGNPNRVAEAEYKLRTISQGPREFSNYIAEFQRYASEVTWGEPALLAALKAGLSNDIQKSLITIPEEPVTMAGWIAVCNRLDTRIRQ